MGRQLLQSSRLLPTPGDRPTYPPRPRTCRCRIPRHTRSSGDWGGPSPSASAAPDFIRQFREPWVNETGLCWFRPDPTSGIRPPGLGAQELRGCPVSSPTERLDAKLRPLGVETRGRADSHIEPLKLRCGGREAASPQAGGQTQRRFTVQDAMAKKTELEGKASVASEASSPPARTSPGACHRQRQHRAGHPRPLYPWRKAVLETCPKCACAGGPLRGPRIPPRVLRLNTVIRADQRVLRLNTVIRADQRVLRLNTVIRADQRVLRLNTVIRADQRVLRLNTVIRADQRVLRLNTVIRADQRVLRLNTVIRADQRVLRLNTVIRADQRVLRLNTVIRADQRVLRLNTVIRADQRVLKINTIIQADQRVLRFNTIIQADQQGLRLNTVIQADQQGLRLNTIVQADQRVFRLNRVVQANQSGAQNKTGEFTGSVTRATPDAG
ncbi:hypothetical protein M91_01478 [Bos mutus]|uniref:Uncharacterized protein n=1 Tax=Bos mutus TaxID=72004 RepID=L8IDD4_9CETA|nr:hypothetical protein M91_01478 [Bos mutus]